MRGVPVVKGGVDQPFCPVSGVDFGDQLTGLTSTRAFYLEILMTVVTLSPSAVQDVLKAVLPFAGKDAVLPALCAVQLDTIDGYLVASATNRFVIGRSRAKVTEGELAGPFLLAAADAKRF